LNEFLVTAKSFSTRSRETIRTDNEAIKTAGDVRRIVIQSRSTTVRVNSPRQ